MNDYILFNGISTSTVGVVVTALPERIIPEERVTFTSVPGRSGDLTTLQGDNVFNDIILSVECYCPNPTPQVIQDIQAYFRGSGKLRIPTRPNGYYEARVINQISFEKILRGNAPREFTVNFRCKPLFKLDSGEIEQSISSGDFVTNPTGIGAKPIIEITGSGDLTLMVGTQIIYLTDIDTGIVLDSEMQEAYYDGTLLNSHMTGSFPILGAGATAISVTGDVAAIKITPRWVER